MGLSFKGGSTNWRSLSENVDSLIADPRYHFINGFFGEKHPQSQYSHDLYFDDPIQASKDFYDKIAYGGIESFHSEGHWITKMKDGTYIDYRVVTSSEGSPAVLINVKDSNDAGKVKYHKIHFSKGTGGN